MDKKYEYRIVWGMPDSPVAQIKINDLALEGFRVINVSAAGSECTKAWCWTMEREVLPPHPYR